MRQRFLPLKLALAVILAASLSADPARAVDDVAEYTGSKQPVTTRLGVPKSQRDPSPWWSFGKGEEKKEEDRSIDDGMAKSSIAYPTGKISTSSLLLEKSYPRTVRLGTEYSYKIMVTNLTDLTLQDVSVSEIIPAGFELISASPNYTSKSGDQTIWDVGAMDPNATITLTLKGKATSKDQLPCCTSADYANPALCSVSDVVTPDIAVALKAPAEVTTCDRIPLEYTVTNTGDSLLSDVAVMATLPSGVTTPDGKSAVSIDVGELSAGQSKRVVAYGKARSAGTYNFNAKASSNAASAMAGQQSTRVVQPGVTVAAEVDRNTTYAGRPVMFTFTVQNNSSTPTNDTVLQAKLSSGLDPFSPSDGGRASGNNLTWNIGTLAAGAKKSVTVKAVGKDIGGAMAEAMAQATCTDVQQDTVQTMVKGIPALLLEVVDLIDPIEKGGQETYVVTVTNQGTAKATNIKIKAMLEGMAHIGTTGVTNSSLSGNTIMFSPLPALAPKEKAQWNIKVSGEKTGDLRFKVSMESDDLTRPVEETESTYVY
ncbi:MAG: DUF11 domain-containing protein [Candidatus Omnitrophica bacterium]|nr:DUF11 domain-containing protein [Candidatus Omnitrophota bacterium]